MVVIQNQPHIFFKQIHLKLYQKKQWEAIGWRILHIQTVESNC
jgi:hypothetical protein